MASGGRRARSGPAPDPTSQTSIVHGREFVVLRPQRGGRSPAWPLDEQSDAESRVWGSLWRKPQAAMWRKLGVELQVAAYVRAFCESVEAGASAGLKTAVIRMETELGISTSGMLQNGWVIEGTREADAVEPAKAGEKRRTSTGSWLEAVKVEA